MDDNEANKGGIASRIRRRRIVEETIEGVGKVRIRLLTAGELLPTANEPDPVLGTRKLIAMAVVDEKDRSVFASEDDVLSIDIPMLDALGKKVMDVNRLKVADAKKKSPTPPSSP